VDPCSSPTMEALNIPFPPSRPSTSHAPSSPPATPLSPTHPWRDDMSTSFNPSRTFVIRSKLQELETKIVSVESELEADLRVARNLALLSAFQKSTRDKVQLSVIALAKRVQSLRLEFSKLRCHRHALTRDLRSAEEERKMSRRSNASRRRSLYSPPVGIGATYHDLTLAGPQLQRSKTSSASASFGTVKDESGRPGVTRSRLPSTPDLPRSASAYTLFEQNWVGFDRGTPTLDVAENGTQATSTGPQSTQGDQFDDETRAVVASLEEAEEWSNTRAAKRVSLVEFPSNIASRPFPRSGLATIPKSPSQY